MDEKQEGQGHGNAFVRLIDWMNEKLMASIGPPPLGPYDALVERVGEGVCPICGHPMGEHLIDHSTPNAVLHCPAPAIEKPESDAVLNEVGMPKRSS